jgi:hypothetical protein
MKKNNKNSDEVVTKEYLKSCLSASGKRMLMYIDHKFEKLDKMADDFYEFKDKVLTILDRVSGNYKKLDEEHITLTEQYKRVDEKFNDHETRLLVLEKGKKYQ